MNAKNENMDNRETVLKNRKKIVFKLAVFIRYIFRSDKLLREFESRRLDKVLLEAEEDLTYHKLSELTIKEFNEFDFELYRKSPYPILIKGLAKEHIMSRKWTPKYFGEKFGDMKVPVTVLNESGFTVDVKDHYHTELRNVTASIQAGELDRKYIDNFSDFFLNHPELLEDLPIEQCKNNFGMDYLGAQLFMGGKETRTRWHCANKFNFFMNVYGQKEWLLAHPKYSPWFKPHINKTGIYAFSTAPQKAGEEDIFYNRIHKFRVVLEEGDVLLNPPWWWHAVNNVSDGSIGVAARFDANLLRYNQNKLFTWLQIITPHQWRVAWRISSGKKLNDKLNKDKLGAYQDPRLK